ncbi:MAG: ribosome small subunit-dependent GTPase A [Burkholderiaceae bacterium]
MQDFLDLRALRDIGLSHATVQAALAQARPDGSRLARVIEIQRDHLLVHDGTESHVAVPWPALRAALEQEHDSLVVGDWVWWRAAASDSDRGWAVARLPARNRLTRRDPAGGRQGLVANIDTALIVMGLDHDFNLRRLDRFLVLAQSADARVVVVLTKADGCADIAGATLRVRTHVGDARDDIAVVAVDGRSPASAAVLAPWLTRGTTLVTLGSSGAGKTTLTNTLTGARETTHAVRATDERGQHTTTARTLHRSEGGACLIDTPGLRQLWLDADSDTLNAAFPEIGALALQCRYRDCRHAQEPACAVREQVPAARLVSFQKLMREANREQADVFQRRRQVSEMKQRTRENRARNAARGSGENT